MDKARTLVLGASHWHVPLYAERIAVRHNVIGLSDPDTRLVQDLTNLWGAPVYTDWRRMIDESTDIDLAYVFVPHSQMKQACLALIERGVAIVVEKPAGVSRDELRNIKHAAKAADVPIAIPLVQRGGPVDLWLSKAGRSVYESVQFIAGPPSRYEEASPWMLDAAQSGGGCTVNLAPHFVDLFLQSAQAEAPSVVAAMSSALHGTGVEDYSAMTIRTRDGRIATIETGYAFPSSPLKRHCSYVRIGTHGTASIWSDGRASFTSAGGATETSEFDVDSDPLYPVFVDNVAERLDRGFEGLPTIDDLEKTMSLIWLAYDYSRRGDSNDKQHPEH
ncbi:MULTISPECIES: Gfo/Idh/MocA family protein [unclassified Actinomyces]|uniref:Gfo/Idh/MocA family protein n=1 Tax=unclassified Actinomyces TaxID=2609248 RepID=UPI000D5950F5|nr:MULTISPECIES: Gfo/Idh/MocA family oxidoreductase [unclassified Actinomyces]RAX21316.1 gfo/Idh/MocA family oxidoreductase [Actinomyces sp. Z5]RAX22656.1 gfo/Idh/MocA family oxidoreductase [Actinomyces sp. Z3]